MLTHTDLKKGVRFIFNKEPYEVIESSFLFKGRGGSTVQTKIKNLITGNIISKTIHPSDTFEEAEISKIEVKYLYQHRDKYFFCEKNNPSKRFDLTSGQIGKGSRFLKPDQIVEGIAFSARGGPALGWKEKIVDISLPIKTNLKVIEAPPGIKGGRAEPGTKTVTLETGTKINVPLFIKEGDIIEINTQTGEYVRRSE